MRVSEAGEGDVASWLALAAEVEPLFGPMPELTTTLRRNIERGSALVVRDDEGAVAAGLLLGGGGADRRISWLAVRAECRGRGFGEALVREALARCGPDATVSVVTFGNDITQGAAARRLYERAGFRPDGTVADGPEGGSRQRYLRRPRRDWWAWHADYGDPVSDLSRRRRCVQGHIAAYLDQGNGPVRVVSACAGDGSDLLGVLARRADAARVSGVLLETDPGLAQAAEAGASGVPGLEVRVADAGATDSYAGAVPADLVMLCGVFGNISDADIRATIAALPQLCASDATVIWTRGRDDGDTVTKVRAWLSEAGLAEHAFDAPEDAKYRVGVHRFAGRPEPLQPGRRLFAFLR